MKRLVIVFVLVLSCLMVAPCYAQQSPNHYGKVIHYLSVMFKTAPPSKIDVNVVSQKEITKLYNDLVYQDAVRGCPNGADGMMCRLRVRRQIDETPRYVKGLWLNDKDPSVFHVVLYKGEDNIETLVHEWLHWYLFNLTDPRGIANQHEIVYPLVVQILTSPDFTKFLESLDES